MNSGEQAGLYVHIPFCLTKCPYCDFYSTTSLDLIPFWLEALDREASLRAGRFGVFGSLYLGGGTPSLLDRSRLELLLCSLVRHFSFAPDTEITIEVNPDDVTPSALRDYRDLGINRISMGVQSFDASELHHLGRRHSARQTIKAIEYIRASEIDNLGLDLMYGLEHQSEAAWMRNLERAVSYSPEHLSCYQLTIADETPFGAARAEGGLRLPGDKYQSDLFILTSRFLQEHGYIHYEVSNFARKPSCYSRHNLKYWRHVPYLGLGPSAHSFIDGSRWWNVRSVRKYVEALSRGASPIEEEETLSADQLRLEALMLGLRTRDGVDLGVLVRNADSDAVLVRLCDSGYVRIHGGRLMPTRKGFLIADSLPILLTD
jgi:oxygen-independent coproporphyrinogen-3 oxidase